MLRGYIAKTLRQVRRLRDEVRVVQSERIFLKYFLLHNTPIPISSLCHTFYQTTQMYNVNSMSFPLSPGMASQQPTVQCKGVVTGTLSCSWEGHRASGLLTRV